MDPVELLVRFEIRGLDCEPEQVTAILGVKPNHSWRRGDPVGNRGETRQSSTWSITAAPSESIDAEEYVLSLLDRLPPTLNGLAAISTRWEAHFSVTIFAGNLSPGFYVTPPTLQRMAALGAALDVDVYATTRVTR